MRTGLGGRKAAKDFTPQERGRCKHRFCQRKPFWLLIGKMVSEGYTANVAIDKVYDVYGGNGSITNILSEIKKIEEKIVSLCFNKTGVFIRLRLSPITL